jgi:hypothetical protein
MGDLDDVLTVPELAERLGIAPAAARQLVKDHELAGLQRGPELVVPARQLDGDLPVKHLGAVLRLLHDNRFTDEEALSWLATEDPSLPGTPFDALHENRATEVKRRAQALGF